MHAKDNKSWRVHSVVTVFRHADRTPKMKLKFAFKGAWSQPFITLLQNRRDEIILRQPAQIQYVYEAANTALQMEDCDEEKLLSLKKILEKKAEVNGTKVQLKPSFDDEGSPEKIQVIVKWGGEVRFGARLLLVGVDKGSTASTVHARSAIPVQRHWREHAQRSVRDTPLCTRGRCMCSHPRAFRFDHHEQVRTSESAWQFRCGRTLTPSVPFTQGYLAQRYHLQQLRVSQTAEPEA